MKKVIFLIAAILVLVTCLTFAEEVRLTTIIPNQTTLRVKKGVVGENYSDLTKPGAVTDTNIPTSSLLVEGNLGIGTTTPQADLHVLPPAANANIVLGGQNDGVFAHNARLKISSDFAGTGIELYSAGYFNSERYGTRMYKADTGNGIGLQIDTHTYSGGWKWVPSVFIGDGADPKFPLLGIFGGTVIGKTYTGFFLPPSNGLLVEGNVGIGTTDPGTYKLSINGTGYINAASWAYGSDMRLKENVSSIQSGLNVIEQLKPVRFDYIKGEKKQVGFIGQDVQQVLPDAVTKGTDGMLGLKTESIIPYLVKAIQEQQKEIQDLKARLKK